MLFSDNSEDYKHMDTMDIHVPHGTKIIYSGLNGYDYDRIHGDKHLKVGEMYTVKDIDIGSWSTDIILEEHPTFKFNSVMFIQAVI